MRSYRDLMPGWALVIPDDMAFVQIDSDPESFSSMAPTRNMVSFTRPSTQLCWRKS